MNHTGLPSAALCSSFQLGPREANPGSPYLKAG